MIRLRRSGMAKMLRNVSRKFNLLDLLAGAARRFDLLSRRRRELRRLHVELLGQLSVAEDLDPVSGALDEARAAKRALIDGGAIVEAIEVAHVHDGMHFLEDVGESALRQTAMKRHLAAFESEHARIAGARLLPLLSAARRLAVPGARSAPDALLGVARAFFWFQVVQFHRDLGRMKDEG